MGVLSLLRRFACRFDIEYSEKLSTASDTLHGFARRHPFYVRLDHNMKILEVYWCCDGDCGLEKHACDKCSRHCFVRIGVLCFSCYGIRKRHIPDWYYHKGNGHCYKCFTEVLEVFSVKLAEEILIMRSTLKQNES